MQKQIKTMWLDYVNNFISLKGFAEHYDISETLAKALIDEARQYNGN